MGVNSLQAAQVCDSEKLVCLLETEGKTPKYGLIFHSTFLGIENKARVSRHLANKCPMASRTSDIYTV